MRGSLYIVIIYLAATIYSGLAFYVISHAPKRAISWAFAGFCITILTYYLTGIFLYPQNFSQLVTTPLALRIKWVGVSYIPVFYFHMVSFYFRYRWGRVRILALVLIYIGGTFFAGTSLLTNWLIAGPLLRPAPNIIGPIPGPLMPMLVVFYTVVTLSGTISLILTYRTARSPSLRRQIFYLLLPTILLIASAAISWVLILTLNLGSIPHEIGDLLAILSGFFFAKAIMDYGSFLGRPLAWRNLLYASVGVILTLALFYPAILIDFQLMSAHVTHFPLATILLIIAFSASFPILRKVIIYTLDRLFFPTSQRPYLLSDLGQQHAWSPSEPQNMQAELLTTLCDVLDAEGGYLALPDPTGTESHAVVRFVQGNLGIQPGDVVKLSTSGSYSAQVVTPHIKEDLQSPEWQKIALFCRLNLLQGPDGLLAFAHKKSEQAFTHAELALTDAIARQIEASEHMLFLRKQRDLHIENAQKQDQTIQELEAGLFMSDLHRDPDLFASLQPLEIWVLGPMKVWVKSKPVPASAWGSEKAKALLAYLIWKGSVGASREEISLSLWPELDEERSKNNFHVTMNRLRHVLEPDLNRPRDSQFILYQGGKYFFNFNARHWLDVAHFRNLATSSNTAELLQAEEMYHGSYLEDAAWTLPAEVEVERRYLEQLYEKVLRTLIERVSGPEEELFLKKILMLAPGDEEAHERLINYYIKIGRLMLACQELKNWQQEIERLGMDIPQAYQKIQKELMEKCPENGSNFFDRKI